MHQIDLFWRGGVAWMIGVFGVGPMVAGLWLGGPAELWCAEAAGGLATVMLVVLLA